MSYQVFARKYRPQTFDDVVGQEHITRTLKNAILQHRLAHAYLFVGPRGTGKTSTARILSKCLCCVKAPTVEPCGVCDACREIAAGISLDVLEIDGASNNGVEQVRELRDNVRYAPTHGKYKIYIIDEVHMLTPAAFNALLKTLEEPPEHVKFIFATTEPQKVLPTILSRCQRFDLRRIPGPLIAAHLQKIAGLEKIQLAPDAADAIARGAEGGLRDAESMLDQLVAFCGDTIALDDVLGIFGFTAPETVALMADHLLRGDTPAALGVLDSQSESGKDLLRLLAELISHLRNLLVFQVNPGSAKEEIGPVMLRAYETQAALVSPDRLLELIDQFALAENRMKWAPNKKLPFEIALIKAVQSLGQTTLTEVIDALTALREGDPTAVPAGSSNGLSLPPAAERRGSRVDAPQTTAGAGKPPGMDWASLRKAVAKPADLPSSAPAAAAKTEASPASPAPVPTGSAAAKESAVKPAAASTAALPPASQSAPPAADEEKPQSSPAPAPVAAADAAPLDGPRIWRELVGELRSERPLIKGWVPYGRVLSTDNDTFRVGFPTTQRMIFESLGKPNNRKLLETLLTKLSGRPVTLKMELRDEEPSEELPPAQSRGEDSALGTVAEEPAAAVGHHANGARGAAANADTAATSQDSTEAFKNDPLIQKALKIFEGEIRLVEGPGAKQ